jgi:hypothetical protein
MFWLITSLYVASLWWARLDAAARSPATAALSIGERIRWVLAVGFCCGCALALKHTGLSAAGLVLLESFLGLAVLTQVRSCSCHGAVCVPLHWMPAMLQHLSPPPASPPQPALLLEVVGVAVVTVLTFFGWFWAFFQFVALNR